MTDQHNNYTDTPANRYKIWFFAGGETRDDRFNVFTGSFIRLMRSIAGNDFDYVKGIFFKSTARNVLWALNNAQKPISDHKKIKIFPTALRQISDHNGSADTQHIFISSSTGSVVAAQTACYLAEENAAKTLFKKPVHLVLGASMISPSSDLFKKLLFYQEKGLIGRILHDEVQDAGDNTIGVGGVTRLEAYRNAFGIMFPQISFRYKSPSFLNADAETGHIHRRRSKSIVKATDYIDIIFIRHKLAGEHLKRRAEAELIRIKEKI